MRKSWYIVGLGLALAAGGTVPRPADHPGLGVELVRADYGAPLAFWDAVTPVLASRERKVLCDPEDTTVLR